MASVGLAGNNISGIAARGNLIVVTSSDGPGGIYRSTDTGATFTEVVNGGIVSGDNFSDLVADKSDPTGQRLYASNDASDSSGGAIYRSDDFGQNWTKISSAAINATMNTLLTGSDVAEMSVHPTTGRLYVGIIQSGQLKAIYHTNNGTVASPTWTRMDIPLLPRGAGITVANATNASPIVITSQDPLDDIANGNLVYVDGVTGNTAANGVFSIANVNTAAKTFELVNTTGNGAYVSGGSWVRVNSVNPRAKDIHAPGGQGKTHFAILVDPANENRVYVSGDRQDQPSVIGDTKFGGAIFRGDATIAANPNVVPSPQWDHITHNIVAFDPAGGTANGSAPHADSREMVIDAIGNLIEAGDGGITKRTNPTNNTGIWTNISTLGTSELHSIAYDSLSNTLTVGAQDNGVPYQTVAGQTTWGNNLQSGDGGDVLIDNISLAGSNQSIRYTSSQNLGGFTRSIHDATGTLVNSSVPTITVNSLGASFQPQFVTRIALNQQNPPKMVIVGNNSIYESTSISTTDIMLNEIGVGLGPGFAGLTEGALDYGTTANPSALYAGKDDKVLVRLAGTTFATTSPGGGAIKDVVIDPASDQNAFVITASQVYRTLNAGTNWVEITGNIMSMAGEFMQTIEFIPGTAGAIVIGGALGVFTAMIPSLGAATTWTEVGGPTLPNAIVYELEYNTTDNVLVAGTLGRGGWIAAGANSLANVSAAPTVQSVVFDNNAPLETQRSMIRSIQITFDQVVTLSTNAITLRQTVTGPVTFTQNVVNTGGKTLVTMTFSGIGGSLADGNYVLTVDATKVTVGATNMTANRVDNFFRRFGDKNGDRAVDSLDLAAFRNTYGKPSSNIAFDNDFDFNGDGVIDPLDLFQFRSRFGVAFPPPPAPIFVSSFLRIRRI